MFEQLHPLPAQFQVEIGKELDRLSHGYYLLQPHRLDQKVVDIHKISNL